jgi:hypothetical protein
MTLIHEQHGLQVMLIVPLYKLIVPLYNPNCHRTTLIKASDDRYQQLTQTTKETLIRFIATLYTNIHL